MDKHAPPAELRRMDELVLRLDHSEEFFEFLLSPSLVPFFSPPKAELDFHGMAFSQEFFKLRELRLQIVDSSSRADLHMLDSSRLLRQSLFLQSLFPLIAVFIKAHEPCNRGFRRRRDLNEIDSWLHEFQGSFSGKHAEILA